MFTITTHECSDNTFNIPFAYHCVYILENGTDAYIGETNDPSRRYKEHASKSESNYLKKYKFKRIHIISGKYAEETPAKHYEHLLIKLMRADKKFKVVNRNLGQDQHYKRKNVFELQFDKLWLQLEQKGLVETKEFKLVMDSVAYKYSPYTALTNAQQLALTNIVNTIDSGETKPHRVGFKARPIFVSGDAGTGKTVVATSLFYYLKTNEPYKNKKIALVYASTAIRSEIQDVFSSIKGLNRKDVIRPIELTKQDYDIVICDEAHRLRQNKNLGLYSKHFKQGNERLSLSNSHDELDWLLKKSKCQILFYDEKQIASPSDIPFESFKSRLSDDDTRGVRPVSLNEQMRIRAGCKYVPYIFDLLYQRVTEKILFTNYEFYLFTSFRDMAQRIHEKEDRDGLSRLCSSYAWTWKGKKDPSAVDIHIDGVDIKWNSKVQGWLRNEECKCEMGSIYTLAGTDLNYAGVVIGPDIFYDKSDGIIKINKKCFFDDKVKKGSTEASLTEYILNTYAVLLTRGIKGTYVYVCDDNLREYLQSYIPAP